MTEGHVDFYKRLSGLRSKHDAMTAGMETRMRADGLLIVTPKRGYRPPRRGSVWNKIILFLAGAMIFKIFVLYSVGEPTYQDRVNKLAEGTQIEQAGAWLTQIDPVTRAGVDFLIEYLPK
ncbi:MAG: hypothetical protein HRU30_10495 [Rhodobacteraceae bacterium]|nr:hypothetical protein [Paracoccaceae bacterium]